MAASTAEDLYEMARLLPASERLRLLEKIAHDLTPESPRVAPVPAVPPGAPTTRVHLVGHVTELAFDPPRFVVQTSRGPVLIRVAPDLVDAARAAWGQEVVLEVDAVVDDSGAILDAAAVTVEVALAPDDPLAIFDATFGSGAGLWSSADGQQQLSTMRGGT